jgi:hypothetical protein
LEGLSYFSFLGKLLVLPGNVRLDWKGIARYKRSSLFGLIISNEGKKFYEIDTRLSPDSEMCRLVVSWHRLAGRRITTRANIQNGSLMVSLAVRRISISLIVAKKRT